MGCHCTSEYEGKRCQLQALDPKLLPVQECDKSSQPNVIAIVSSSIGAIVFIIVVCCAARYLYKRHKRSSCVIEDGDTHRNGKIGGVDRNRNCKENELEMNELDPLTK